jgi:hypothetical protein
LWMMLRKGERDGEGEIESGETDWGKPWLIGRVGIGDRVGDG